VQALALRLQGASLVQFGVVITEPGGAAASSWWNNVNNLLFGRAKQRLAEKKSVPDGGCFPNKQVVL